MQTATRPAAVAGLFYPADARALRGEVEQFVRDAAVEESAVAPKLLLVPHAGYVYSGAIAASAYALLARWRERVRRVVLLGPTHRVAVAGLVMPTVDAFATPLGSVPIDRAVLAELADLPQVVASDAVHAHEHALEVQLPFLQTVLGAFTLVPLAVGRAAASDVAAVIERLWGGDETLIVISSDLSHFHPYAQAQALDRATVDSILQLQPALTHEQACGATPLAGALLAARAHGLNPRLLDLRNSGDTAGDRDRVVGYCAVSFEPRANHGATERTQDDAQNATTDPMQTNTHAGTTAADDTALGRALLARARNTIAAAFERELLPEPAHDALYEHGATFVTLQLRGQLRGCIGALEATRALDEDVRLHAQQAAFHDPRFPPLQGFEFDEIDIEVSVLEPAQPLPARDEHEARTTLRPGIDGVIFHWRGRRATFLPQVWQQLPTPEAFLAALKRKAGLPADFWADDVQLMRYRVRKFCQSEDEV